MLQKYARVPYALEVGSLCGRSTICIAKVADVVHAIDPHYEDKTCRGFEGVNTLKKLKGNLRLYELERSVHLHVCTTMDLWFWPEDIFNFAFVDGDHSYKWCKSDLEFCGRVVRRDGRIAVHDYFRKSGGGAGVVSAVHEFLTNYGWDITDRAGSLIVMERNS